jgi:hypothetical protein
MTRDAPPFRRDHVAYRVMVRIGRLPEEARVLR